MTTQVGSNPLSTSECYSNMRRAQFSITPHLAPLCLSISPRLPRSMFLCKSRILVWTYGGTDFPKYVCIKVSYIFHRPKVQQGQKYLDAGKVFKTTGAETKKKAAAPCDLILLLTWPLLHLRERRRIRSAPLSSIMTHKRQKN